MVIIKTNLGDLIEIDGGVIKCEDKEMRSLVEKHFEVFDPKNYTPDKDHSFAMELIKIMGGEIIKYDPPEVEPNMIY